MRRWKRSAKKRGEQLRCTCPEDRRMQSDELMTSTICRTDPGANTASEDEERKVLTSVERSTVAVVSRLCKKNTQHWRQGCQDHVSHNVDNRSGSMVATAVQRKGHDNFVERFLLNSLESFGMTSEMVLQTDKKNRTDPCGKTRCS